jgi:hypothetical protein
LLFNWRPFRRFLFGLRLGDLLRLFPNCFPGGFEIVERIEFAFFVQVQFATQFGIVDSENFSMIGFISATKSMPRQQVGQFKFGRSGMCASC